MKPLEIQILSDGKPGHENQSLGLAEALGRLRPVHVSKVALGEVKGAIARFRSAWRQSEELPRPDLLIGAGHATHPALLALGRKTGAPCVVLMKPSLPAALFELCLVPEHDLAGKQAPPDHVVPTRGALNRVPPCDYKAAREDGLILLGGPSSAYGWDGGAITAALKRIAAQAKRPWHVTDSRRTPAGTLDAIAAEVPGMILHPHTETGREWLPQRLSRAAEVWVTEESISMIYEALSSGAHVGLLPVPAIRKAGRVARGIARLAAEGYVTRYEDWAPQFPLAAPPQVLREADRCAAIVVERFFGRR